MTRIELLVGYPMFVVENLPYGIFRSKIDGGLAIQEVLLDH